MIFSFISFALITSSTPTAHPYKPIDHLQAGFSDMTRLSTLGIFVVGSSAAAFSFLGDDKTRNFFNGKNRMAGWRQMGNAYGDYPAQFGLAAFSIAAGFWQNAPELLDFGEADLEALSMTTGTEAALKYSVRRDRPSGGKLSFPSGHTGRAFATAGALWNLGHPLLSGLSLALGSLTIASRLDSNKHYLSDTIFGATLGFTFGYAFSLHHQRDGENHASWSLLPYFESRRDLGLAVQVSY